MSQLKYLLGLVGESIAQGAYLEAIAAVGAPSPGEATQLERIRQAIVNGRTQLTLGQYVLALDLFRDATGRAESFLWVGRSQSIEFNP